jgi:hypothetical protein
MNSFEKTRKIIIDFANHKFREGEYYDKYLSKLLMKYEIDYHTYRIAYNVLSIDRDFHAISQYIWEQAFNNKNYLLELCNMFGWQGGTIHQVIEEVFNLKNNN